MQVEMLFFNKKEQINIQDVKEMLKRIEGLSVKEDSLQLREHKVLYDMKNSPNRRYY